MEAYEIKLWQRCERLADILHVRIDVLMEKFALSNKKTGLTLGTFETVSEVHAFLCGY